MLLNPLKIIFIIKSKEKIVFYSTSILLKLTPFKNVFININCNRNTNFNDNEYFYIYSFTHLFIHSLTHFHFIPFGIANIPTLTNHFWHLSFGAEYANVSWHLSDQFNWLHLLHATTKYTFFFFLPFIYICMGFIEVYDCLYAFMQEQLQ